ncbi:hypothetical protein [Xanthocytophaga agilis]|uniref:Uncharacterized protein n=1 Tax=Xanthocytophaga agilis TaxID=3048010 RepID=A0AAE3R3E2_9BACT|nr:hypothetical protein [Xanthocytophaga agilis]MDJ1500665.1 hypothetical protein [Xanthocytophaga agilis]
MALIGKIRTKGTGQVLPIERVKPALDQDLQQLAQLVKDYIIITAEKGGNHKFRKDKSGLVNTTKVSFNTDGVNIQLPSYAINIDQGRKAKIKKVPIKSLIAWIRRYRIRGRNSKGKFVKRSVSSINALAYAIQNSIYKNGIKARPFIQASIQYGEQVLVEAIDQIIVPQIITEIDFLFNK